MPELPEVESVRRGLAHWAAGARVTGARVLDERILGTTSQREIPQGAGALFAADLADRTILSAERCGKFMWLPLGDSLDGEAAGRGSDSPVPPVTVAAAGSQQSVALAVHLGMSGQFRIHAPADPVHKHTRAVIDLVSAEHGAFELRFVDQRIFGHLGVESLVLGRPLWGPGGRPRAGQAPRIVAASAAGIAPDPFEAGFDAEAVARAAKRRSIAVKTALLDQNLVSGIGNIYADEALFAARVHPLARTDRLRISRLTAALESARAVMARALEVGGTSFDDLYVNVNGESGYFARSLQAYGREGAPCPRCGTPIKRIVLSARSTHFCPRCQRRPRERSGPSR